MSVDWASIAVMVAVGGLLWRQNNALGVRVDALTLEVRDVDRRLSAAIADVDRRLSAAVADVDRRLARLEGWIEGERAGRGRPEQEPGGEA